MHVATMDDLPFTIEEWDAEGLQRVETLARVTNGIIGRAPYDLAVRLRPTAHILFRHGIRVIAEHRPDGSLKISRARE